MKKCIDFETADEKDILTFLRTSTDHIVLAIESPETGKLSYRCGKRSQIRVNNVRTIFDSNKTYSLTYDDMYVCPLDKATLQDMRYCFFKFEYLRSHTSSQLIYNVKKYTLEDYLKY